MYEMFNHCTNENELKSEFRQLARNHHPDQGGDEHLYMLIFDAYELRLKELRRDRALKGTILAGITLLTSVASFFPDDDDDEHDDDEHDDDEHDDATPAPDADTLLPNLTQNNPFFIR